MIKLSFPFTEEKIRALKVGDEVLISGIVLTQAAFSSGVKWLVRVEQRVQIGGV